MRMQQKALPEYRSANTSLCHSGKHHRGLWNIINLSKKDFHVLIYHTICLFDNLNTDLILPFHFISKVPQPFQTATSATSNGGHFHLRFQKWEHTIILWIINVSQLQRRMSYFLLHPKVSHYSSFRVFPTPSYMKMTTCQHLMNN